jgi:hypothetical protein
LKRTLHASLRHTRRRIKKGCLKSRLGIVDSTLQVIGKNLGQILSLNTSKLRIKPLEKKMLKKIETIFLFY